MIKRLPIATAIVAVLSFQSCETEFSVNGNYEITPVVIGLLDYTDSVHIIKITKAFLGEDNNLIYAQIPDSNYFTTVDAWVKEIDPTTDEYTGREWNLTDSTITGKSTDGVFYAPDQKVYVFHESTLLDNMDYELTADLNEGQHAISARTSMLNGFTVQSTILQPTWKINFAPLTVDSDDDYNDWKFSVTEAENAAIYNYKYTMNWRETYTDLTTATFSVERNDGDVLQAKPSDPDAHVQSFSGLDFYAWVGEIVPDDPDVIKRELLGIDLKISVAHHELDQFMDVGAPVTGIVQNKPEYTNVNGGLGLFSTRLVYEVKNYKIDKNSIKQLCEGMYTVSKLFCSWYADDVGELYACP